MGKCIYNLEKDCSNKDCVNCVLEDIKAELNAIPIVTRHGQSGTVMTAQGMRKKLIEILDKHISGKGNVDGKEA